MISDQQDVALALQRAMAYRAKMATIAPGAAQAALRKAIMGSDDTSGMPTRYAAVDEATRLRRIHIADMPPPVDDLSLLIDTIAMRHGYTARADSWRHIGINPNRGRSLLGQNAQAIDWPVWKTARDAAIGE
jgi:hypothetical protein